jgi:uncharacterized protein
MIKRALFNEVKFHIDNPEISLIIGPRQAGKTTLMEEIQDELKLRGAKTLFLSLDNDTDRPFFNTQESLIQKIELEIGKQKGFVFIDEIQRKEDAGLFLKGVYDRNLPYKYIVSGSGSVELKEKVHESLAGRKRIFELLTLSFFEFVDYKTNYRYEGRLMDFLSIDHIQRQRFLEDYLNFGGYPKVVLSETLDEKTKIIGEIYQSYLEKDIAYLLNIRKTESLTNLVRVLASQAGNLVNVSEISGTLGIDIKTVNDYLWYLEKTFIIKRVSPFFKNTRKEITKSPVIYFADLGLKNYAQRQFGTATQSVQNGLTFENFIFLLLSSSLKQQSSLHFWRTQDKAEVDFIIDEGDKVIPIEVKYSTLSKPSVSRSYRSFLTKYAPQSAFVVHLGEHFTQKIDNTLVSFIPFYDIQKVQA